MIPDEAGARAIIAIVSVAVIASLSVFVLESPESQNTVIMAAFALIAALAGVSLQLSKSK